MKGAEFLTQSSYALERVLQIFVWGSGGHLVLDIGQVYVFNLISIHTLLFD